MSLEALTTWSHQLAELAELGGALQAGIESGDSLAAIAAAIEMRRVRHALSLVETTAAAVDARHAGALAETAQLAANANLACGMLDRWLGRTLASERELLATPIGVANVAESLLPGSWDFETQLVVLVGDQLAAVGEVLRALGQRRIVMVASTSPPAGSCDGVIVVRDVDELGLAIRTMLPNPPSRCVVRAAIGRSRDEVAAIAEAADAAIGELRVHRNTVATFSRTWVSQGVANLPALARWPTVAALDDAFVGVPMVIVAPGPSLARNIDQLAALRGRAVIVALSHSLRPLIAAGVTPDAVIAVDPQDVRYHFAGCDVSESVVINAATVHPSLFDLPARGLLSLSANSVIDTWLFEGLGETPLVAGGGSVATTAYSLALRWRCDPIVFVGLDLSFPGGQYYVASSHDGQARAEIRDGVMRVAGWSESFHAMKRAGGPNAASERVIELPGWSGGTVPSGFMFGMFHRWFVERTRHCGTTTVYNCTEGGAYIEGMRHVPLRELALAGEIDAAARFASAFAATAVAPRTAAMVSHVERMVQRVRRCRTIARRGRELIASGESERKLRRVERALAAGLRPLSVASLLAQRDIDRADDRARRRGELSEFLAATDQLFAAAERALGELEPVLTRASSELRRPR